MSSEEDSAQLMAAFKKQSSSRIPSAVSRRTSTPLPASADASVPAPTAFVPINKPPKTRNMAYVRVSPVRNKEEYTYHEPREEVEVIIREFTKRGEMTYEVRLYGDEIKQISFDELLGLPGGSQALERLQREYDPSETSSTADEGDMRLRRASNKAKNNGFVDISTVAISSSDEDEEFNSDEELNSDEPESRRRARTSAKRGARNGRYANLADLSTSQDDLDDDVPKRRGRPKKRRVLQEPIRRSTRQPAQVQPYDDEDESEENTDDSSASDILRSDVLPGHKRKRSKWPLRPEKVPRTGMRQSNRATRATNNMQDPGMKDVYRSDSEPRVATQKLTVTREIFETLPRSNLFRSRHAEGCEVCYDGPSVAALVYCQGCSLAYHKNCLGNRSTRDHLVTKVGDETFVLQCKRCINFYKKKDATAPDLSKCQDCSRPGSSCQPFRRRKTTQQEMKDREENDGQDPCVDVPPALIKNAHNVLFRCTKCSRAWHYHHLPPISKYAMDINRNDEETAEERFREYSNKWLCKECDSTQDQKVGGIIAWRPSDVETYLPGTACELVSEDDKQYLLKWENQSYFRAAWFSGAWTWGVTAAAMRKAFFKREDGPKMRTEDAIPEEYLRIDIILDIKYTSYVEVRSEEIDKARIKEVDRALIKYKGLGYEDSVWEKVPKAEDGERWLDFVTAYNDWVAGRYVRYPKQGPLKIRLEKARNTPFTNLEREKQPENLVGGELMKYQIEGLNWLYYQWYSQKNGILADEMGLGKTIQVIAFLATLIQEHNCFPFLIVVPNSTCANWRREIKQWAPSLRVVAYFGSAQARDMAYKYEMYPEGTKELRCHIVVTSYEAAADDSCRRFFKSVNWAGMIVDEGQRLKNDKSQLYTALTAVRSPFRLLLTGTPLQNNARELFNLLHFLDDTIDAAALEEKYAEMTSDNIKDLHDQIRPFILRRTKAQVLTFLPPLGQVILPISMSHLQKQLYKSILSKRPELLKALFTSAQSLKQQERANLSNILMQLRKCLCHPFVYSRDIEERTDVAAVSHRNLVEASAKLSLLELILPKLQERGHRVLIFSQFLDMLNIIEDFLDGMQLPYQRLDGTMGSLEKQKRIDQYNAPDSPLFAFLLSTRAGGVGINLATADTVIILDPDWNPHQDLQAIARAHRIGQKNKVLCLQLTTRASVEEKIMQMGRKKMALDHVVVEQLDADDIEDHDVESILKFGAAELFRDEDADHDIRYDDASIEKLLDRSQIESTKTGHDTSAESQFSFARIWAQDKGSLQDDFDNADEEIAPDPGVWDKILKERQAIAAAEALARAEAMGRGRRAKAAVDYATERDDGLNTTSAHDDGDRLEGALALPTSSKKNKKRHHISHNSESDTDFQASSSENSDASEVESDAEKAVVSSEEVCTPGKAKYSKDMGASLHVFPAITLQGQAPPSRAGVKMDRVKQADDGLSRGHNPDINVPEKQDLRAFRPANDPYPPQTAENASLARASSKTPKSQHMLPKPFVRATLPTINTLPLSFYYTGPAHLCSACRKTHPTGACEFKEAGVEHCGLCGLAHYGHSRTCPHIKSETQVRAMLEALKNSAEKKELVDAATKYLRGVKGTLVQQKKRDREKAMMAKGMDGSAAGPAASASDGGGIARPPASTAASPGNAAFANQQSNAVPHQPYYANGATANSSHLNPAPGSVGSVLQGQTTMQAQGLNDQQVESALRGFLRAG